MSTTSSSSSCSDFEKAEDENDLREVPQIANTVYYKLWLLIRDKKLLSFLTLVCGISIILNISFVIKIYKDIDSQIIVLQLLFYVMLWMLEFMLGYGFHSKYKNEEHKYWSIYALLVIHTTKNIISTIFLNYLTSDSFYNFLIFLAIYEGPWLIWGIYLFFTNIKSIYHFLNRIFNDKPFTYLGIFLGTLSWLPLYYTTKLYYKMISDDSDESDETSIKNDIFFAIIILQLIDTIVFMMFFPCSDFEKDKFKILKDYSKERIGINIGFYSFLIKNIFNSLLIVIPYYFWNEEFISYLDYFYKLLIINNFLIAEVLLGIIIFKILKFIGYNLIVYPIKACYYQKNNAATNNVGNVELA